MEYAEVHVRVAAGANVGVAGQVTVALLSETVNGPFSVVLPVLVIL
jgi:hypothetical protein